VITVIIDLQRAFIHMLTLDQLESFRIAFQTPSQMIAEHVQPDITVAKVLTLSQIHLLNVLLGTTVLKIARLELRILVLVELIQQT
jgi:hypothetical protein